MNKLKSFLKGKKTYITAIVSVIYAGSAFYTGHMGAKEAIDTTLVALGFAGIRNAL